MRRAQSMESLPMLPEEAKMAASLLRLTLSDKQETSTESDFQSYISKHSHFPYHKAVPSNSVLLKSEPLPIRGVVTTKPACRRIPLLAEEKGSRARTLKQRCDSSPSSISCEEMKTVKSTSRLSQSAPVENEGFFQRFFPSFLKRRLSDEKKNETTSVTVIATVQSERKRGSCGSNHFVNQFTRVSKNSNMDNLIFMSMR